MSWVRESLRCGTWAGLAMIPFAAWFRGHGLRINEYGRKTLALAVGDVPEPLHTGLSFVQHMMISWVVALPLLFALRHVEARAARILLGAAYGAGFYVVANAWALPRLFGDPLPWQLGVDTVYPSLLVHLVYGAVVGGSARARVGATAASRA